MLVFGVGLSMTVAPLTTTVLGAVPQHHAGVASGTNNAIARVAALVAIAAVGAVVAARYDAALDGDVHGERLSARERAALPAAHGEVLAGGSNAGPRLDAAVRGASIDSYHWGAGVAALLVAMGGAISLAGIQNPSRRAVALPQ